MEKPPEQLKEYQTIIRKYLKFIYETYNIHEDDRGSRVDVYSGPMQGMNDYYSFIDRSKNNMFDEIKKECLTSDNKNVIASDLLLIIDGHGTMINNAFILPDTVNITLMGAIELMTISVFDPFIFFPSTFIDDKKPIELYEIFMLADNYFNKYINNENYTKELYTALYALKKVFSRYKNIPYVQSKSEDLLFKTFMPGSLCPDVSFSAHQSKNRKYIDTLTFYFQIEKNGKKLDKLFMFNTIKNIQLSEIIDLLVETFLEYKQDGRKERISEPINIQIFVDSCLGVNYNNYMGSYPRYLLNRCLNLFPSKYNFKHLGISPYDQIDEEIRRASLIFSEKPNNVYIYRNRLIKGNEFFSTSNKGIPYDEVVNNPKIDFLKMEKSMSAVDGLKIFTYLNKIINNNIYQQFKNIQNKYDLIDLSLRQEIRERSSIEPILKTAYFREWSLVLKEFPEVEVPPQFKFLVETMQGSIEQLQWLIEQKKRDKSLNNIPNMTEGYDYVEYMMKKGYKNLKESSIQDGDFTKDERFLSEIIDTLNWIINNDLYYYQNILNENVRYENNDLFTVFLYTLKVLSNNYLNLNYKYGVTSLVYNLTPPSFDKEIFPFIFPYDIRAFIQKQLPFYRIVLKKYKTLCSDENENKASCAEIERQIDNKLVESEPYLYSTCNFLSSLPCFFIYLNKYLHSTELDIKGLNEYLDELYPSAKSVFDDRNMLSYTPDRGLYFLLKQFIHYVRHKINTK